MAFFSGKSDVRAKRRKLQETLGDFSTYLPSRKRPGEDDPSEIKGSRASTGNGRCRTTGTDLGSLFRRPSSDGRRTQRDDEDEGSTVSMSGDYGRSLCYDSADVEERYGRKETGENRRET